MGNKALLHKSKLNEFLEYVAQQGADLLVTKGDFEVARFRMPGEQAPHLIFKRLSGDHYTLQDKSVRLYWAWRKLLELQDDEEQTASVGRGYGRLISNITRATGCSEMTAAAIIAEVTRWLDSEEKPAGDVPWEE